NRRRRTSPAPTTPSPKGSSETLADILGVIECSACGRQRGPQLLGVGGLGQAGAQAGRKGVCPALFTAARGQGDQEGRLSACRLVRRATSKPSSPCRR